MTSFPGLQVLEDSEIYDEIEGAGLHGYAVPQRFEGGTWRACVREIYGPLNFEQPLEYTWQPGNVSYLPNMYEAKEFGAYWSKL